MIQAVSNVTGMSLKSWAAGILRSIIVGGTSSLGSYFGITTSGIINPTNTNLVWHVLWVTFAFGAGAHLIVFLQTHPLPGDNGQ